MLQYVVRRVILAIPTLFGISVVSFVVMNLAPGDFMSSLAAQLAQMGEGISGEQLEALRKAYGLDQPVYIQYLKWISGIVLRGDFGLSLEWRVPVAELIWQRIGVTIAFTSVTILVSWLVAVPIGVYSATHRYTFLDYLITGISFLFLGIPGFTIALVALWVSFSYFGADVAGAFILLLGTLVMIGTLLSDIALAWVDPRIRYDRR